MSSDQDFTMLTAALNYASQGYAVFPCHNITANGNCSCGKPEGKGHKSGKHPRTEHGHLDATTDLATIEAWWTQYPDANIGMATGKINGTVVVDVDTSGEKKGAETLAALCDKHGTEWLNTRQARTGSGGTHLLFKYPDGVDHIPSGTYTFGKDIDCRADGGLIIVPPSNHISGGTYEWLNDLEPQPMPDWLLALAVKETPQNKNTGRVGSAHQGVTPLTVKRLIAALPWVAADEYDTWLKVGAAMKFAGLKVEDWVEWSKRSDKFDEGVCEEKWESFRRDSGEVVTLATIFHMAKGAGWPADGRWSEEEMDAADATINEGIKALGIRQGGGEDVRAAANDLLKAHCFTLDALRNWRLVAYNPIKAALAPLAGLGKSDFDRVVKQTVETQALAQANTLEGHGGEGRKNKWLSNFALIMMDNRYVDLRDGGVLSPEVFTKVAEREFPRGWEEIPALLQFSREQNEFVRHDCYYPGEGRIVVKESTIGRIENLVNTYNAPQDLPVPRYDAGQERLFRDHLMYVCGGETGFVEALLNWIAYIIQYPGRRINWVPLIIGPKGNGKTFIADLMTAILGKSNVGIISNDDLSGSFQDGLAFKQLLVLEEFKVFEGQNSMMDRFKPWVTNERVGVNRKGLKKITIDNVANTIAFSNHEDAIRIDEDERRYAVAISRFPVKEETFYTELFKTFIPKFGGSVASVLYLLKHRDLSAFNPYAPAVWTASRDEMIENNRSALERELAKQLEAREGELESDLITFEQLARVVRYAQVHSGGVHETKLSNYIIAKAAKAVGIEKMAGQKRLTAGGQPVKRWVYSTRNHEHWRTASEGAVREWFEAQEASVSATRPTGNVVQLRAA